VVVARATVVVGAVVADTAAMVVDGAIVVVVSRSGAAESSPERMTAVAIPVPTTRLARTAIAMGIRRTIPLR
ncbi:MAG TPA: hypothetical protein VFK43_08830, partial [Acidimicrobiales bacterium]|nr:hypothetical protein [Acidimicrobiales bacterium]